MTAESRQLAKRLTAELTGAQNRERARRGVVPPSRLLPSRFGSPHRRNEPMPPTERMLRRIVTSTGEYIVREGDDA